MADGYGKYNGGETLMRTSKSDRYGLDKREDTEHHLGQQSTGEQERRGADFRAATGAQDGQAMPQAETDNGICDETMVKLNGGCVFDEVRQPW